jgi:hypothetical protein
MDEFNWKEEQRSVLARLFDSAFKRREFPEAETQAGSRQLSSIVEKPDPPHSPGRDKLA